MAFQGDQAVLQILPFYLQASDILDDAYKIPLDSTIYT